MAKATRKRLISLIKDIGADKHRIDHTDRCKWENMNHGGDCDCGVIGWPNHPGFLERIQAILDDEK